MTFTSKIKPQRLPLIGLSEKSKKTFCPFSSLLLRICFSLFLSLILFSSLSSCSNKSNHKTNKSNNTEKETILLGLLPTQDCIPFAIAQEKGIFDSLGIKVKVIFLNSQMDMDQMLSKGEIDVGATDLFRTILLQNERKPIRFVKSTTREWKLMAAKRLRIQRSDQLGDRMVGMTRHSALDFYCDYLSGQLKKNSGMLLKPQINDVFIRLRMLNDNQLDAAILPYPLSELASQHGNTTLASCNKQTDGFSGFAVYSQIPKEKANQLPLLFKAYNSAIDSIKANPIRKTSPYLLQNFQIDSLDIKLQKSPSFSHAYSPQNKSISEALKWLKAKDRVRKGYSTDTLLYKLN